MPVNSAVMFVIYNIIESQLIRCVFGEGTKRNFV